MRERVGGDRRRIARSLGVAGRKMLFGLLRVGDRFLGRGYEFVELGGDVVVRSDQSLPFRGRNRTLRREKVIFKNGAAPEVELTFASLHVRLRFGACNGVHTIPFTYPARCT